jgi:UDP-glucose 4-epimerase
MRYFITGGAGFIGTALANRLSAEGHEVRVLDDVSAGDPTRLHKDVVFTRGDVNDVPKLWSLMRNVDCVYHLAARVSVPESMLYARDYNAVNVGGTVSVLEAVRDAGAKRIVLSSSGAVYGEQQTQPLTETMRPDPRSPYAVSKLAAEYYVRTTGILWSIETVSLRIFNTYGPGQRWAGAHPPVVPSFIRQVVRGGSVVIFGSGEQTRDYVYIDDVIDALVAASTAPSVDRQVINVGSGVETSMNDLVEYIGRLTGKMPNVLHNTAESGGVTRMRSDLTLAADKLGFKPKYDLAAGLRHLLALDGQFAPK